jgi:hypothetical protein
VDIHALPSNHQELQLTHSSSEDHEQFTSKDSQNESREDEQRKQSVVKNIHLFLFLLFFLNLVRKAKDDFEDTTRMVTKRKKLH